MAKQSKRDSTHVDVLILGAGAAGLSAARVLSDAGLSVIIVERDRIGGRVHTVHDSEWPVPIELGAEFIHGRPPETFEITRTANLTAYDVTDSHLYWQRGRLAQSPDFWDRLQRVMKRLDRLKRGEDISYNDFQKKYASDLPASDRTRATMYVEGFNAADRHRISAASLAEAEKASKEIDGDKMFRLLGGYDTVMHAIRTGLHPQRVAVHLSTVVTRIEWDESGVSFTCHDALSSARSKTYRARRAIITLPIGVLRARAGAAGAVQFHPPLPKHVRDAIGCIEMGPVAKLLLRFDHAFWEKGAHQDLGFFHAPGEVFPTWWTTAPLRSPVLTGWAGGPAAAALSGKSLKTVLPAAIRSLAKLLKVKPAEIQRKLAAAHFADWRTDPFSRGAYSYPAVGARGAVKTLMAPIENTLYLAGEAIQQGLTGTVASAIASGRRAAESLLNAR